MSTYTNNLNLIKPGYDDDIDVAQLNNNMDVLDTQVSNAITVNDDQNRRLTDLENKTYPYLPLTGGTMTGAIKSDGEVLLLGGTNLLGINKDGNIYNNGIPQEFIMSVSTVTNIVQNYRYPTTDRVTIRETVTKYSNGKQEIELVVTHIYENQNLGVKDYTFSSPFVDDNITTLDGITNTGGFGSYADLTCQVVSCTATSIGFETDDYVKKYTLLVRGYWK